MNCGLDELSEKLSRAWSVRTASTWSAANPARGQCSVTALAVQRLFGGEILKTPTAAGPHFYNRIAGVRRDFTAAQFEAPVVYLDLPSTKEEALADTSPEQLDVLLSSLGFAG